MKNWGLIICLFLVVACQKRKEYLIQVPTESHITSNEILTELENQAIQSPENDRLIRQQLYFCEQLGWPTRCEQALIRARNKWGLTEKLLDQSIAYYQKHGQYETVASLLNGAFETRSRLETKITIAASQEPGDYTFLDRYLSQFQDAEAYSFASDIYLLHNDTTEVLNAFQKLFELEPGHKDLVNYYPILQLRNEHQKAIRIIDNQLSKGIKNNQINYDLALNYHEIDSLDKAKKILRKLGSKKAKSKLINWFRVSQEWDSALAYTNQLLANEPQSKELILAKAEVLESKGWVTPSLPYYEQAFALDTTDTELANRLEIVRRKVAYLRRKREEESQILPPDLERKTGN